MLNIHIYDQEGTFLNRIERYSDLRYSSQVPGGCDSCSFTVARDTTREWRDLKHFYKIKVLDDADWVYEGRIETIGKQLDPGDRFEVEVLGLWVNTTDRIYNACWADNRLGSWKIPYNYTLWPDRYRPDIYQLDKSDHLRFMPVHGENYFQYAFSMTQYTMHFGENIRRITADYNKVNTEGEWNMLLAKPDPWTPYLTPEEGHFPGSGSLDITPGTPYPQEIVFGIQAAANNGAYGGNTGTTYCELLNLMVYCTTYIANASNILLSILAYCDDLSVGDLGGEWPYEGRDLAPIIFENDGYCAEAINILSQFDDTSGDGVSYDLIIRENGITDWVKRKYDVTDYMVRAEDCQIDLGESGDKMRNKIRAKYTDEEGETQRTSWDEDTTSSSKFGVTREKVLDTGQVDVAIAERMARSHRDYFAYPSQKASLVITRGIYDGKGRRVPLTRVRAGKMIKIIGLENKASLFTAGRDFKNSFFIKATEYDDSRGTLKITPENPSDEMEFQLANLR